MIRTLYNTEKFRDAILNISIKKEINNCLCQLQNLFYKMKTIKDKHYYNPKLFIENFENKIIEVDKKNDIHEFFVELLDKWEIRLSNAINSDLIKYFFEGIFIKEIYFKDLCNHNYHNNNKFDFLCLNIKNMKILY